MQSTQEWAKNLIKFAERLLDGNSKLSDILDAAEKCGMKMSFNLVKKEEGSFTTVVDSYDE